MPLTLNSTPGDPAANTYALVADADNYFLRRPALYKTTWVAATADDKAAALAMATEALDASFVWNGAPTTTTQALAFPRTGLTNRNGDIVADDAIPQPIVDATSELAQQLLSVNRIADNDIARLGITDLAAGSVKLSFKDDVPETELPRVIPDFVRYIIPGTWYTVPESATGAPTILLESM